MPLAIKDVTQMMYIHTDPCMDLKMRLFDARWTTQAHTQTVDPLYKGHRWAQLAALYRKVSLKQRQICTQLYVVWTAHKCPH